MLCAELRTAGGARDFCLNLRAGRRLRLKPSGPIGMRSSPRDGNPGALCALAVQGGPARMRLPGIRDSAELRGLTAKIRGALLNSGFDWGRNIRICPPIFSRGAGFLRILKNGPALTGMPRKGQKNHAPFRVRPGGFYFPAQDSISQIRFPFHYLFQVLLKYTAFRDARRRKIARTCVLRAARGVCYFHPVIFDSG